MLCPEACKNVQVSCKKSPQKETFVLEYNYVRAHPVAVSLHFMVKCSILFLIRGTGSRGTMLYSIALLNVSR